MTTFPVRDSQPHRRRSLKSRNKNDVQNSVRYSARDSASAPFNKEIIFSHSQSVQRLAAGWTSGGLNPGGGQIFRTRPDLSWGPTSLLYNEYRVSFPGVKRLGRGVDHPPHLASRLKKEQSHTSAPAVDLRGLLQGELYLYLYHFLSHTYLFITYYSS